MDDAAVDKKIDEIKALLERIDRKRAAAWRHRADDEISGESIGPASNADLLMAEYRDFLAGKRTSGPGPWIFLFAMALNMIVVVAVAGIVLGTMGHSAGFPSFWEPRADPLRIAKHGQSMLVMEPVELAPLGTRESPIGLAAGKPTPLPLKVTRGGTGAADGFFVLSKFPRSTTLTGATRIGSDQWVLPFEAREELEATAERTDGPIPFEVQLRYASGAVAARAEGWLKVDAPETGTASAGREAAAVAALMRKGERLLATGDIVTARGLYERAADEGSAEAALVLGATYDPNRLWFLGTLGIAGNKERARQWYRRAEQLGHPDAKTRLQALAN